MKIQKRLLAFLLSLIVAFVCAVPSISAQSQYRSFDKHYSLSGDPVTDIISVAKAQLGRTGADFGYTVAWDCSFISDCAFLSGQAAAIPPADSLTEFRDQLLRSGGHEVNSPQAGDIVFYSSGSQLTHVALMIDSEYSIHGNMNPKNGFDGSCAEYKASYVNKNDTRSFIRPNYRFSPTAPRSRRYEAIEEGEYNIVSVAGGQYLNAFANSGQAAPATNVVISNADGTPEQNYRIEAAGGNQYYIRCLSNSNQYCVNAMSNETVESGNNVKLWHYNTDPSKCWYFEPAGDGCYLIVNAKNQDVVLTAEGAAHRANVSVQTRRGDTLQIWRLERVDQAPPVTGYEAVSEGNYHIVSAAGGQYLNAFANAGLASPRTRVVISNADGTPEQNYRLQSAGDNRYYIRCLSNDDQYCVNAMSGDTVVSGNDVQLWHYNSDPSKFWYFRPAGNGNYYIVNAKNENVVLTADSASHRANVTVQTYRGDVLQEWRLERIGEQSTAPSQDFANIAEGNYHIVSVAGGQYLNAFANAGQAAPATNVVISNADGSPEQNYRLQAIGDNQYYIRCLSNDNQYCVNAMSGDTVVSGNDVQLWQYNTDPSKYWYFRPTGNGNYYIVNAKNQNVVLTPDSATHRANVTVQTYRGDVLQQWRLDRIDQPAVTPPEEIKPTTFEYDRGSATVKLDRKLIDQSPQSFHDDLAVLSVGLSSAAYKGDKATGEYIYNAYRSLGFADKNIALYSYPGHKRNQSNYSFAQDNDLAFSIAYRQVDDEYLLTVVFRGTYLSILKPGDIVKDVESYAKSLEPFYTYKAANGFYQFYNDARNALTDYLGKHSEISEAGKKHKVKILITGHSLGGAAAQLLGVAMSNSLFDFDEDSIFVYTFASPKVVIDDKNLGLDSLYAANVFNVVNPNDAVPIMPPAKYVSTGILSGRNFPFCNFGTVLYLRLPQDLNLFKAHDYTTYADYVKSVADKNAYAFGAASADASAFLSGAVACPVDVSILDKDGNTVAYTKGDESVIGDDGVILYVDDDVKYFIMPSAAEYRLKLDATGEGTMAYALFTEGDKGAESLVEYKDVALVKDKQFEAMYYPETGGAPLYGTNAKGVYTARVAADGTETQLLFGDLDGNGKVSADDARLALRFSAKLETPTALQENLADTDGNGKVTADDARKILRVCAKLERF